MSLKMLKKVNVQAGYLALIVGFGKCIEEAVGHLKEAAPLPEGARVMRRHGGRKQVTLTISVRSGIRVELGNMVSESIVRH